MIPYSRSKYHISESAYHSVSIVFSFSAILAVTAPFVFDWNYNYIVVYFFILLNCHSSWNYGLQKGKCYELHCVAPNFTCWSPNTLIVAVFRDRVWFNVGHNPVSTFIAMKRQVLWAKQLGTMTCEISISWPPAAQSWLRASPHPFLHRGSACRHARGSRTSSVAPSHPDFCRMFLQCSSLWWPHFKLRALPLPHH